MLEVVLVAQLLLGLMVLCLYRLKYRLTWVAVFLVQAAEVVSTTVACEAEDVQEARVLGEQVLVY